MWVVGNHPILSEGLEHPRILVSAGALKPIRFRNTVNASGLRLLEEWELTA